MLDIGPADAGSRRDGQEDVHMAVGEAASVRPAAGAATAGSGGRRLRAGSRAEERR